MHSAIFHLRKHSLVRGSLLVLVSVLLAFWLSDFPHNRATPLLLLPAFGAILGTVDTARCIQRRWNLYHGGVILCLYMDLMAVVLVLFALLFPYGIRLATAH